MASFKSMKIRAMGVCASQTPTRGNSFENNTRITFEAIKASDLNYQTLFRRNQPAFTNRLDNKPLIRRSPLAKGKENISINHTKKREDCSKFAKLLENKGYSSAGKNTTFGALKRKNTVPQTDRKQLDGSQLSLIKKRKLFSEREMQARSSLQQLRLELLTPQKMKGKGKCTKKVQKHIETVYFSFDSLLSDIECINGSKDDTIQFGLTPLLK